MHEFSAVGPYLGKALAGSGECEAAGCQVAWAKLCQRGSMLRLFLVLAFTVLLQALSGLSSLGACASGEARGASGGSDFEMLFARQGADVLTYHYCSAGVGEDWAANCRSTDSQNWLAFRRDGTVEGVLFEEAVKGTWSAQRSSVTVKAGEETAVYTLMGSYLAESLGFWGDYETFVLAK